MSARTLKSEARGLQVVTLIALVLLSVGLAVRYLLLPFVAALRETAPGSWEFWSLLGPWLIEALPAFALLGAVEASHKLFARLAEGELFGETVAKGVRGIGGSLIYAAVAMAVIVPWLQAWVDGKYGFGGIHLDPVTVVLAVVGAAMLLLGRLLKRAGAMQSELESYV